MTTPATRNTRSNVCDPNSTMHAAIDTPHAPRRDGR